MIVVCPACQARFQYDDSRFGAARTKRFKCPKCSHVFEVVNPALAQAPLGGTLAHPMPAPAPMPEAEPTPPTPIPAARTTAKRDREAMLVAAGLHVPGMPPGLKFTLAFLTGPHASTVQGLEQPQIVHRDSTVWISDQQATNGTLVNGERITGPVQLASQQEFTCGNSTFMLLVRNTEEFPLH